MSNIARSIARKDRLELVRDNRLRMALILVVLLSLAAVLAAYTKVSQAQRDRIAATSTERDSWLGQSARDPHAAAHFAQWVFRPMDGVALLEPGAMPYTGSAIWLEAHHRNPAAFRPVEDRSGALDQGEFSAAWVLQTLGSLLALLLAAGLVARERESATLRLLMASGAAPADIVVAKARGLFVTVLLTVLPVFIAAGAALLLASSAHVGDMLMRALLWTGTHVLWLAVVVLAGVAISARAPSTSRALVLLIALWVLSVLLAPRLAAGVAQALHPVPTGAQFIQTVQKQIREGVGDIPSAAQRNANLRAQLLREYQVEKLEDLPISLRGAQLEAGEEADAAVYARNYAALDDIYAAQRRYMRVASLISPLIAVQNLSAAFAGTDNVHLRAFDNQAEAERMKIGRILNRDLKMNGAGNPDYKADARLWQQLDEFHFQPLPLSQMLHVIWSDVLILLLWLTGALWALRTAGQRLNREVMQ